MSKLIQIRHKISQNQCETHHFHLISQPLFVLSHPPKYNSLSSGLSSFRNVTTIVGFVTFRIHPCRVRLGSRTGRYLSSVDLKSSTLPSFKVIWSDTGQGSFVQALKELRRKSPFSCESTRNKRNDVPIGVVMEQHLDASFGIGEDTSVDQSGQELSQFSSERISCRNCVALTVVHAGRAQAS